VTHEANAPERLLTAAELEIMTVLWRLGEGTVAEVREALSRSLAYTSVSTLLRILEQKQVVASRKHGRGHLYRPRVPKEAYERVSLRHLLGRVFDGAPVSLVRRLLEEEELSAGELKELRRLLARKARS
jgi:predicted transcriptional regulator